MDMRARSWGILLRGALPALWLAAAPAQELPATLALDPARAGWTELDFEAAKFLLSASTRVQARLLPAAQLGGQLLGAPAGQPVPPGAQALEMIYTARGLGKAAVTTLWADPRSGATLQRLTLDDGNEPRQRTYRFTDIGAYHYTRRPRTPEERVLPPAQWTDRSEGMRAFPAEAVGQPVSEPTVLLWLAAAARLDRPGDRVQLLGFSRRHVHRVTIEVAGTKTVQVDYTRRHGARAERRRGEVRALALRIRGTPLAPRPGEEEDFEMLGLHGDLELLLDPATRVPLQLRGRIKVIGEVRVRLRAVTLG